MPGEMQAAFTGDVISDTTADGRRVLSLAETGVRDFAFVLSSDYVIGTDTVDGIEVRVAIPKEGEEYMDEAMGCATKSLALYDRYFGKYTNDTFTVAFSDFDSGMEYPGIVLIAASYLKDTEGSYYIEMVIAHEIGHQWWYSAVGNDEVDEAWLDEGLTSFTEMVYYSDSYGWEAMPVFFPQTEPKEGLPLNSPLSAFSGWDDYGYVYSFGQTFFKTLMDKMGQNEFFTMMQKYYATYAYGIATAEDLRSLVAETGNADALEWYDEYVFGK
jgi:aminopeptidase N